MVAFDSLPVMNTGVVMAIFCFVSFPPVMNLNNRLKLPFIPLSRPCVGVSTTFNGG